MDLLDIPTIWPSGSLSPAHREVKTKVGDSRAQLW